MCGDNRKSMCLSANERTTVSVHSIQMQQLNEDVYVDEKDTCHLELAL